jgi:hypothetical protein
MPPPSCATQQVGLIGSETAGACGLQPTSKQAQRLGRTARRYTPTLVDHSQNEHLSRANDANVCVMWEVLPGGRGLGCPAAHVHTCDIARLGPRASAAADWAASRPDIGALPIGCFGASTGAAAALIPAAERPGVIAAVVSRGGRSDLARRGTRPREGADAADCRWSRRACRRAQS